MLDWYTETYIGDEEMTQQLRALTALYSRRPAFGLPAPILKVKDCL